MLKKSRKFRIFIAIFTLALSILPTAAHADGEPSLKSISFTEATIEGDFSPEILNYTLILDSQNAEPTLENYSINGEAELFVSYIQDAAGAQTGIAATLKYSGGQKVYTFTYKTENTAQASANNLLTAINCEYGQLKPEFSPDETQYTLYLPYDLTELEITTTAQDAAAKAPSLDMTLRKGQETVLSLNCIAADGEKREYRLVVKRSEKTLAQVQKEIASGAKPTYPENEEESADDRLPIICCAAAGAIILLIIIIKLTRRLTVKTTDDEEKPFYIQSANKQEEQEEKDKKDKNDAK